MRVGQQGRCQSTVVSRKDEFDLLRCKNLPFPDSSGGILGETITSPSRLSQPGEEVERQMTLVMSGNHFEKDMIPSPESNLEDISHALTVNRWPRVISEVRSRAWINPRQFAELHQLGKVHLWGLGLHVLSGEVTGLLLGVILWLDQAGIEVNGIEKGRYRVVRDNGDSLVGE